MNTSSSPSGAVVVGVDGSEHSMRAAVWAANEAAVHHAPLLLLVHARGEPGTAATVRRGEQDPSGEDVERFLAEAADRARTGHAALHVETCVVPEDAGRVLLRLSGAASVVVVGSRGHGPLRSRLLGSVGVSVVRSASSPVAVVRPHLLGPMRKGVLVAVDGSADSIPTLEFACAEAAARRLPLTVTQVPGTDATFDGPDDLHSPCREDLLGAAVATLAEAHPGVPIELDVRCGHSARALAAAGATMDMLVVGRPDHRAGAAAAAADLSQHVVEHADTVVIVVPEVRLPGVPWEHPELSTANDRKDDAHV